MDYLWRLLITSVLIAGCLGDTQAVTPRLDAMQMTTQQCVNCPNKTTTRRTTTHSTLHTTHTTAAPTTTHTSHTTEPHTTAHTNHTTTPHTTAHTSHTTEPHTTAHTNHTTTPHTTAHTNHTTTPHTTAHTNHTTEPHTTAHTNHTTTPHTTAHTNHTTTPHTTAHTNHTTTPHTTAHTNHTTEPHTNNTTPHQTTHSPPPSTTEYFVNGTSGVCLRIKATFVLTLNISKLLNYTIPPPPMTKASGSCGADAAELMLTFPEGSLSLTFKKDTKKSSYYLGAITVTREEKEGTWIRHSTNLTGMVTPLGRSFTCNHVNLEVVSTVNLLLLDVKAQAIELQGGNYGREMKCMDKPSRDKTVPIVVGVVLVVLIIVVVAAYLISRALKRRTAGYQPL